MKSFALRTQIVIALLAFSFCGTIARAQYTVVGTTPGGGNIIVGNGPGLPSVGPGAPFSAGGFDQVTINPGATANGTLFLITTNDSVINKGVLAVGGTGSSQRGVLYDAITDNINNSIANFGNYSVTGGNGFGVFGALFYAEIGNNTGNNLTNSGNYVVTGGNYTIYGAWFDARNYSTGNSLANSGNFTVNGGADSSTYGVWFESGNNSTNDSFTNSGNFTVNGGADSSIFGAWFNTNGSNTGDSFTNSGNFTVTGGDSSSVYGAWFNAGGNNTGNSFTNSGNFTATGGNNGSVYGAWFDANGNNNGNTFNNTSTGNISATGGANSAVYGVWFNGPSNGNSVINSGEMMVTGGLGSTVVDVLFSNGNGNTITNWGELDTCGPAINQKAISITGNNNTINLMGHSTTEGMIQAVGANNVLNIDLSGLSPAAIANITSTLAAQGVLNGVPSSGSIMIRGNLIQWDPLTVHLGLTSYQLQGITPGQQAVGASLDSALVNPDPGTSLANLFNGIDRSGNVPLALGELSPQVFQIYGDIALAQENFLGLEIDRRLNDLRDGSESVDTTGIGGGSDATTAGFSKDGKDGKGVIQTSGPEKRWGFFASGGGIFTNIDARGGLAPSGFTTSELVLGVDGKINDRFVVGLLFNYDYTTAGLDNIGSTANVQTFGGGIYGGYHDGGWYANGLVNYGHNQYDSMRNIFLPGFTQVANGSTDGNQVAVNIDGGYDFHINDHLSVGPLAGLEYVHLDVDGFNESGAGAANLSVGSQDVDSLRSRLGVRMEYTRQLGREVMFGTELRAEWQHEFLNDSRGINGNFIGAGLAPFSVATTSPERDAAVLGVGANFTVRDRVTFFVDYDVQAGQQSYLEQSVKGGLKFRW